MDSRASDQHGAPGSAPSIALERGALVTFEGPDGSGKSTFAAGCKTFLEAQGYGPVAVFREPGESASGHRIRDLSRAGRDSITPEEEIALFIEDRKWDLATNIEPVLAQRGVVLLDRYYHSSIAYQGVRCGDPARVRRLNEAFARRPDLIVLLRLDVKTCLDRIRLARGDRPDLFEERTSLEQVCVLFDAMEDEEILRLDGTQPLAVLQGQINETVAALLRRRHA